MNAKQQATPSKHPAVSSTTQPPRRGAVAVVVRQARLLVIERSQFVRAPGAHCFPGGGIEQGETEQSALRRELREELQAEIRPLRRLWECVTASRVHLAWWQAELIGEGGLLAEPAEVASVHWMLPAEMLALPTLLETNRRFLEALARGEFTVDGLAADRAD